MKDEVYFWHADKHQFHNISFYKLTLSFCVCIARHVQSNENIFAYLCNISGKTWRDEVDFLPTDKCKTFLQVDSIYPYFWRQVCPKYPK